MSRLKLPRPNGTSPRSSLRDSLSAMRASFSSEAQQAREKALWINTLAKRAKIHPMADTDPGPPPQMPDMNTVLQDARMKAAKMGAITAGVHAWKESYDLYREYKDGKTITFKRVATSAKKIGQQSMLASRATSSRHMTIVSLDTLAHVVAWQSARRASKSVTWKALHIVSKKLAGRAGAVMMAAEVFRTMKHDIERYREGELSEPHFYRNCALTGISILAPMAGATAGPVAGSVGIAVAIGAGMMRK